jgi:hypothetical protein
MEIRCTLNMLKNFSKCFTIKLEPSGAKIQIQIEEHLHPHNNNEPCFYIKN